MSEFIDDEDVFLFNSEDEQTGVSPPKKEFFKVQRAHINDDIAIVVWTEDRPTGIVCTRHQALKLAAQLVYAAKYDEADFLHEFHLAEAFQLEEPSLKYHRPGRKKNSSW